MMIARPATGPSARATSTCDGAASSRPAGSMITEATSPPASAAEDALVERLMLPLLGLEHELRI